MALIEGASAAARDYAIASAYALLIGEEKRRKLSAYFTPPALAAAAIEAAEDLIKDKDFPYVLDPACGGGSFLTEISTMLVDRAASRGTSSTRACSKVLERLSGIELDTGLARLSTKLVRRIMTERYDYRRPANGALVWRADALRANLKQRFDLIVGNPPYGKVGRSVAPQILAQAGEAALGGHTNFYALFLVRALDWLRPGGGLVFVLPTSFVAGPYFAGLRREVLARAEVVSIDLHEQREYLFVDAVQDVCLLVLRRKDPKNAAMKGGGWYKLGYIDASGKRHPIGQAEAKPDGEPWTLPVLGLAKGAEVRKTAEKAFTLEDYGYRVRVGKVVPTRERDRLKTKRTKKSLPLLWASDVRPDGSFLYGGSERGENASWYVPATAGPISYCIRGRAVVVQRTSNREQRRRLNAAPVSRTFLRNEGSGGFVAENHVIVLEPTSKKPRVAPEALAHLLNSAPANDRFSAVSGSFSVSARLLARLALPDWARLPDHKDAGYAAKLSRAFSRVGPLLAQLKAPGDLEHAID
ncbi:Eco57I restriction-modification methylase domain-containing protein [Dongia soli]|uniref:site-specific DNA-methyltransferase (adenine-specific) n=1 Tax=Dongia soli TaxID=600628 RepID=A0ABU5EGA4_9PROT|nr:N-6 DNA methylase [Dongia soli]MDY0885391.1 N-6 DNA methylase [Dongia soli]